MREYERLGHMQRITNSGQQNKLVYYIKHHCVTKKFRVVFDASCKTDTSVSLNEVQLVGEKLQKDLFELVMRLRRHRIAMSLDVSMMFRQVRVARSQWDLQRIFWRENPAEPLSEYWLTVVTYGMAASAHIAVRAMIQCARDSARMYPRAADAIQNDFYMDDCVSGADSVEQAIELAREINYVLATVGFTRRKWTSNSAALLQSMKSDQEESMTFSHGELTSVLGLKWLIEQDRFTYEVKMPELSERVTKREIVSKVAQLFDPNGFISPVTITGKMMIQELWRDGVDWDSEVSTEIEECWHNYWRDINQLEEFQIQRWLGASEKNLIDVHGFSDASERAYKAAIYVRVKTGSQFMTTLLTAITQGRTFETGNYS